MSRALRNVLVVLWSAMAVIAQRTWTVDLNTNHPADFRDLPPAIAAASPGDTLIVHASNVFASYSPFTLSKGINVVTYRNDLASVAGAVTIANIPAGESCMLCRIDGYPLVVRDCQGPVSLVSSGYSAVGTGFGVSILNSKLVTMWSSGNSPMLFDKSTVVVLDGGASYSTRGSGMIPLTIRDATAYFVGSYLLGDPGLVDLIQCRQVKPPYHAVNASNSDLYLIGPNAFCYGGAQTGGIYCNNLDHSAPAIVSTGLGVRVFIEDLANINTIQGPNTVTRATRPFLTSWTVPPGNAATVTLRSKLPNALSHLFVALPALPLATPFGDVYFDPLSSILLDVGFTDASGKRDVTFMMPANAPYGLPLVYQSAVLTSSTVEISAPLVLAIANT